MGDAPVYVGFGSMGFAKDADRRREAIITALARAGVRGVLATGWGGIAGRRRRPERDHHRQRAPHAGCFRGWRPSCTTAALAQPLPDCAPAAPP